MIGIFRLDADHADGVPHQQQRLRILHRHHDECVVIFVDADLENRRDAIGYDAGQRAGWRRLTSQVDHTESRAKGFDDRLSGMDSEGALGITSH